MRKAKFTNRKSWGYHTSTMVDYHRMKPKSIAEISLNQRLFLLEGYKEM